MSKSTMKIENGTQVWRLPNGDIHREDGPAVINEDFQNWYINGELHCENGPAHINIHTNTKVWYINGKRHRDDGPAVIDGDKKEYWINGKQLTEFQYWHLVGKNNLEISNG